MENIMGSFASIFCFDVDICAKQNSWEYLGALTVLLRFTRDYKQLGRLVLSISANVLMQTSQQPYSFKCTHRTYTTHMAQSWFPAQTVTIVIAVISLGTQGSTTSGFLVSKNGSKNGLVGQMCRQGAVGNRYTSILLLRLLLFLKKKSLKCFV